MALSALENDWRDRTVKPPDEVNSQLPSTLENLLQPMATIPAALTTGSHRIQANCGICNC
jgi:hypothetical protein